MDFREIKLHNQTKLNSLIFTFFLVILITGCSSTYAPVEQRSAASYEKKRQYSGKTPTSYTVRKGDTLFSIAWLYGLDYKTIARINSIKTPYYIYAGQKLRLKSSLLKKTTQYQAAKRRSVTKSTTKKQVKKSTANKTISLKSSAKLNWSWPVKGKIIQHYSPTRGKKGIDISAAQGVIIKSSEAGKVVYSGQGLVGYGRMVIIKHSETFLSAYAHNQNLLVNEGQFVKKGQTIARLGRSGTDRFKLHFEIRKNGKPVNPLIYLPR